MRANSVLFLILFVVLALARLGLVAVTMVPGISHWDHPTIPLVVGIAAGLALRDHPRSIVGVGLTLLIALTAIVITELSIALLVASRSPGIPMTNLAVIMLGYWANQPAYLLFSVLGLVLSIPVYWSRGQQTG